MSGACWCRVDQGHGAVASVRAFAAAAASSSSSALAQQQQRLLAASFLAFVLACAVAQQLARAAADFRARFCRHTASLCQLVLWMGLGADEQSHLKKTKNKGKNLRFHSFGNGKVAVAVAKDCAVGIGAVRSTRKHSHGCVTDGEHPLVLRRVDLELYGRRAAGSEAVVHHFELVHAVLTLSASARPLEKAIFREQQQNTRQRTEP